GNILSSPMKGDDSGTGVPLPAGMPLPEIEKTKKIPLRPGDRVLREDVTKERPYEQLNPWLNTDLQIYEETRNGKREGWFMLVITAKENNVLKVIPKDVFFIIDTSSSIGAGRLFEFKSAVTQSLKDLNPKDRFNFITFRKTARNYSKVFVPGSPAALADVRQYFTDVDSEGRTDLFKALTPLAALPRERDRMRMAIL